MARWNMALDYLISKSDCNGFVNVNTRELARYVGCPRYNVSSLLQDLRRKKHIMLVSRGVGSSASQYKILDKPTIDHIETKPSIVQELFGNIEPKPTNVISVFKSKVVSFMQEICQMDDMVLLLTAERDQYKTLFEEAQRKIEKSKECLQ